MAKVTELCYHKLKVREQRELYILVIIKHIVMQLHN